MINRMLFDDQMREVALATGSKSPPDHRLDYYYNYFKDRGDDTDFRRAIRTTIETVSFFPKISEILKCWPRKTGTIDSRRPPGCERCDQTGLVRFVVEREGYEYDRVAACTCEAGRWQQGIRYGKRTMRCIDDVLPPEPQYPWNQQEGDNE